MNISVVCAYRLYNYFVKYFKNIIVMAMVITLVEFRFLSICIENNGIKKYQVIINIIYDNKI